MSLRLRRYKGPAASDSDSDNGNNNQQSTGAASGLRMNSKENRIIARKQFEKLPSSWDQRVKIDFSNYTEDEMNEQPLIRGNFVTNLPLKLTNAHLKSLLPPFDESLDIGKKPLEFQRKLEVTEPIVEAYIECACRYRNDNQEEGREISSCVMIPGELTKRWSSYKLCTDVLPKITETLEKHNCAGENFQQLDYLLMPILDDELLHEDDPGWHYLLLCLAPKQRALIIMDSALDKGYNNVHEWPLDHLRAILLHILNLNNYNEAKSEGWNLYNEWCSKSPKNDPRSPPCKKQGDHYNCGIYTCTNALCLCFGYDLMCYKYDYLDRGKRPRMAAELMNDGFNPPFNYQLLPIPQKLKRVNIMDDEKRLKVDEDNNRYSDDEGGENIPRIPKMDLNLALAQRGLIQSGKREELVERLQTYDAGVVDYDAFTLAKLIKIAEERQSIDITDIREILVARLREDDQRRRQTNVDDNEADEYKGHQEENNPTGGKVPLDQESHPENEVEPNIMGSSPVDRYEGKPLEELKQLLKNRGFLATAQKGTEEMLRGRLQAYDDKNPETWPQLTVVKLKKILQDSGLNITGTKIALIQGLENNPAAIVLIDSLGDDDQGSEDDNPIPAGQRRRRGRRTRNRRIRDGTEDTKRHSPIVETTPTTVICSPEPEQDITTGSTSMDWAPQFPPAKFRKSMFLYPITERRFENVETKSELINLCKRYGIKNYAWWSEMEIGVFRLWMEYEMAEKDALSQASEIGSPKSSLEKLDDECATERPQKKKAKDNVSKKCSRETSSPDKPSKRTKYL